MSTDKFGGVSEQFFNAKKSVSNDKAKDGAEKKAMTPKEKALAKILKKAGIPAAPPLKDLLRGKQGPKIPIKDIAIFLGKPTGIIKEVFESCPNLNRVNLSTEVCEKRVLSVGLQLFESGRMYQPIHVARIKEDGKLECTSGRHRLVFLALVYGADSEVPVYLEDMTLNEARDATVVSNQARRIQALERAEHVVLKSVAGNADAELDEMYARVVLSKSRAKKYCVFCVFDKGYPAKFDFKVAKEGSSRKDGELMTVANLEVFWSNALPWKKGFPRKDFDAALKGSIKFLNELVTKMTAIAGFRPNQHLAAMTLAAIGKYYRGYNEVQGKNAIDIVGDIARTVVALGDCGRTKSEETYENICKALAPKK